MSKRKQRVRNRKLILEELAFAGELSCAKHQSILTPIEIRNKRCYTGNRGKDYCKYLRGYQ